MSQEDLSKQAISYLIEKYSPGGNRVGWIMLASVFVDGWDLYSISIILIFLRQIFHPSAFLLGLTSAAPQVGAILGALLGGYITDKIGRRASFLTTMLMFIIFAMLQAFAPNMVTLAIIRFFLGIPTGWDISTGFTYIMESIQKGRREIMGNRYQIMFTLGEMAAIPIVIALVLAHVNPDLIWRVALGLGAVPAFIVFLLRYGLPESVIWLISQNRFADAKKEAMKLYNDSLPMLPDVNYPKPRVKVSDYFVMLRNDKIRLRGTIFGWLANFAVGSEFATIGFYLPLFLVLLHVSSSIVTTNLLTFGVYCVALVSSIVGPALLPKIGQKGLSTYGFSVVILGIIIVALGIYSRILFLVPLGAAIMFWGHYWANENGVTVSSVSSLPVYRGVASGISYMFVKIGVFLSILLFPPFFTAIGEGAATLFVLIFPLIGLLSALFILPKELNYGYKEI